MTARATGTIDLTIYDTINLKRRHGTRYHTTNPVLMSYIVWTEKLSANLHERRGGELDDIRLGG